MTEAELRHWIAIMQLQVVISELQADNLRYQIQERQAALTALQEVQATVPQEEKTMSTRSGGVPIKPPPGTGGSVKTTAKPKPKPKG